MEGDRAVLRARQRQSRWVPMLGVTLLALYLVFAWPVLAWAWSVRAYPGAQMVLAYFVAAMSFNVGVTLFSLLAHHITRVVLTATHLHVHRGLRTDDIALDAITEVRSEEARVGPQHTLWGALTRREWTYVSYGAKRTLRIVYRGAKGRARTVWVQLDDADAVAAQLAPRRGTGTGVRAVSEAEAHDATDDVADAGESMRAREGRAAAAR